MHEEAAWGRKVSTENYANLNLVRVHFEIVSEISPIVQRNGLIRVELPL